VSVDQLRKPDKLVARIQPGAEQIVDLGFRQGLGRVAPTRRFAVQ